MAIFRWQLKSQFIWLFAGLGTAFLGGIACGLSLAPRVTISDTESANFQDTAADGSGTTYRRTMLATPSRPNVATLRRDPGRISESFAASQNALMQALGPAFESLSDQELRYVFASIVAHAWAPFGGSTATQWDELQSCETLNCSNYAILTARLAELLIGREDRDYRLRFIGWESAAIGNHQMIMVIRRDGGKSLLLDPTIGLVALTDFDTVASSRPIEADQLVVVPARDDLLGFERAVCSTLILGRLKPSDLLFDFDGLDHLFNRYGDPQIWPTPGARTWRERARQTTAQQKGVANSHD